MSGLTALNQDGKTYHPLDGYAQSMFANIQFMKGLAASYAGRSMGAFSVNPGSESAHRKIQAILNLRPYQTPN